jgi:nicotinamide-nucleotide amidase
MREIIGRALERSDVVITLGGIGPTEDDLTRELVAEVTDRHLALDRSCCSRWRNAPANAAFS